MLYKNKYTRKDGATMVEQDLREGSKKFTEAYNQGDAAATADHYTEDAKLLPPNREMVSGKRAIQEFWKGAMDAGVQRIELETAEVGYDGDVGYVRGISNVTIRMEDGKEVTDKGKYLVILKRQSDGSWKVAFDIWNSDSPPHP